MVVVYVSEGALRVTLILPDNPTRHARAPIIHNLKIHPTLISTLSTSFSFFRFINFIIITHAKPCSSMNKRRTLLFRNGSVHYSNKDAKGSSNKSDSSQIDIEVRSARINRETSKPFAEFELLISIRVRSKLGHAINQWSVYKRYSEISELNKLIKAQFGWQTEKIAFPPKKMFGTLDPAFLEKRRGELDHYFSQILSLPDVADFKKHFSSQDLKIFIDYDANKDVKPSAEKISVAEEKMGDSSATGKNSGNTRKKKKGLTRKTSHRRTRRRSRAREERESSSSTSAETPASETLALENVAGEHSAGDVKSSAGATALGPEYQQFLTMQKAGVPEGAIRQKMMSMSIDPDPMFGGEGSSGSHGGAGGAQPPPPKPPSSSGGRPPPPLPAKVSRDPPVPVSTRQQKTAKKPSGVGGRGGLLAQIQKGKMLKKTVTKEPKSPAEAAAAPAAPANPMMAAILARRKRIE